MGLKLLMTEGHLRLWELAVTFKHNSTVTHGSNTQVKRLFNGGEHKKDDYDGW